MNRRAFLPARLASRIEIMRLLALLEGPRVDSVSVGCLRKANEEPAPGGLLHGSSGVGPPQGEP